MGWYQSHNRYPLGSGGCLCTQYSCSSCLCSVSCLACLCSSRLICLRIFSRVLWAGCVLGWRVFWGLSSSATYLMFLHVSQLTKDHLVSRSVSHVICYLWLIGLLPDCLILSRSVDVCNICHTCGVPPQVHITKCANECSSICMLGWYHQLGCWKVMFAICLGCFCSLEIKFCSSLSMSWSRKHVGVDGDHVMVVWCLGVLVISIVLLRPSTAGSQGWVWWTGHSCLLSNLDRRLLWDVQVLSFF